MISRLSKQTNLVSYDCLHVLGHKPYYKADKCGSHLSSHRRHPTDRGHANCLLSPIYLPNKSHFAEEDRAHPRVRRQRGPRGAAVGAHQAQDGALQRRSGMETSLMDFYTHRSRSFHFRCFHSITNCRTNWGFSCCLIFSGARAAAQGGVSGARGGSPMAGRAVPGDGGSPGLGE